MDTKTETIIAAPLEVIKRFEKSVDYFAKNNMNFPFKNSGEDHAGIVISRLFKHATSIIKIYARDLQGEICDKPFILQEIDNFLNKKGSRLEILLKDRSPQQSSKVKTLIENIQHAHLNKVYVKDASQAFLKAIGNILPDDKDNFFITGDKKMYRLEYDNIRHAAICNFNDSSTVKRLNKIFDTHSPFCK